MEVGGAEMMLKKLLLERKNAGENDVVICLRGSGFVGRNLAKEGIVVHYLCIQTLYGLLKGAFELNKLIKNYSPEIIQTWLYHADLIGGIIGFLNNIPVIWNIRQTKFTSKANLGTICVMRFCALLSYNLPSKIICAASASRQSHIGYGYCKRKMVIIPNGFLVSKEIDRHLVEYKKQALGILSTHTVIGTVGRFHADKDYSNFTNAAAILVSRYPNLLFIMVGKQLDDQNGILVKLLRDRGLMSNFILVGEAQDVTLYYSLMDIFCLSSASEGFPNVLGEAMLMGVPCVSTDVGDASVIIKDTGFIVKPQNSVELANALEKFIVMSPLERNEFGRHGKERIIANFLLPSIAKRYTNLYNEVAPNKICVE